MHEQFTHPSYDEIHEACVKVLVPQISRGAMAQTPTRILGLSRGGMIPATIVSHAFGDMPVTPVAYSAKNGQGSGKNDNLMPEVDDEVLLIVDDICDSGLTMLEVYSGYNMRGHTCLTAVLYYKEIPHGPIVPHFQWRIIPHDAPWIIFPWEAVD